MSIFRKTPDFFPKQALLQESNVPEHLNRGYRMLSASRSGSSQPVRSPKKRLVPISQGRSLNPVTCALFIALASTLILLTGTRLEKAGAETPPAPISPQTAGPQSDPAALQIRFEKVIKDSLVRQRIPFSQFSWLAPKAVNSDILALPFSIVVGAQKITLPVYIIDHRYLVTTPLLDITQHNAVVQNIPPPVQVSLFIPSTTFPMDQFPATGPASAPHSLIEFGDDQCHTCRKWNREVEEEILKDKTIRFTYIPYPLASVHKNALGAAIFEMCVFQAKPGAFWNVHDQLNRRVDLKNVDDKALKPIFSGFMLQAGIASPAVNSCMEQQEPLPLISRAGDSLTSRIGVPTAPIFIIDGHVRSGYLSAEEIRKTFATGASSSIKPAS